MPIFHLAGDGAQLRADRLDAATFKGQDVLEKNLQGLLKRQIDILGPEQRILIVAEEFCAWEDSRRRIDLLGIDEDANLVVFELKRTERGGHMELQAIRYAAMISKMTFEKLVDTYADYLRNGDIPGREDVPDREAAESEVLNFLGWNEPNEEEFGRQVKIVLASQNFSRELTTSVLWLRDEYGLDIRCVRMAPYMKEKDVFLNVETIIPLPEAERYQTQIREKRQEAQRAERGRRGRFTVRIDGDSIANLSARRAAWEMVARILKAHAGEESGAAERIRSCTKRGNRRLLKFDGKLTAEEIEIEAEQPHYYFTEEREIFYDENGNTWALTLMWRTVSMTDFAQDLGREFPELGIAVEEQSSE